jgi:hypothetical protein
MGTLYMKQGTEELQIPTIFYILPLGDIFLSVYLFFVAQNLKPEHKENVSEDASHSPQE